MEVFGERKLGVERPERDAAWRRLKKEDILCTKARNFYLRRIIHRGSQVDACLVGVDEG